MYKVVWKCKKSGVGHELFKCHMKAKLFFYYMMKKTSVVEGELRKV